MLNQNLLVNGKNVTTHHLAEASSQVVCYIKVNCWTAEKHLDHGGDGFSDRDCCGGDDTDGGVGI